MEYHYDKNNLPGDGGGQPPQSAGGPDLKLGWGHPGAESGFPHSQPRQTAPPPEPRFEARYVPQYEVNYGAQDKKPPKGKKRGAGRVLGTIALVAACAVAGFGGGYAAVSTYGGNETVVYKTPEGDELTPSGISAGGGLSVSDIADKAGRSVVSITTENMVTDYFTGGRVESGAGSGVIISEDGVIVTNHHVISGAQNITVTLPDGAEYPATVLGSDANTDIAVIKINATGLTPATIGDSASLSVGEFCLAIGNPMGTLGGTVTDGIVSALDRQITIDGYTMNLLQMSAAVSPGNSGGGLFNDRGELIGIVNAKSSGDGAEGLGFAVPANTAMQIAEAIISNGYVARPGLGVMVETVTQESIDDGTFALPGQQPGQQATQPGLYVAEITAGGAAEKAGIQPGDRIVEAGGAAIEALEDLRTVLNKHEIGDELAITVARGDKTLAFSVTLQELIA